MHFFVDIFSSLIVPSTAWTDCEVRKRWFWVKSWITVKVSKVRDRLLTQQWKGCSSENWFLRNFVKTSKFGVSGSERETWVGLSDVESGFPLWQTDTISRPHPPTRRVSKIQNNRWLLASSYGLITAEIVTNPGYLDFLKVVSQTSKLVAGLTEWQVQAPP